MSLIPQAHGNADYEVKQAAGEAHRRVKTSGAEADAIQRVADALRSASNVLRNMLWREKLETALSDKPKIIAPNRQSVDKVSLWKGRSAGSGAKARHLRPDRNAAGGSMGDSAKIAGRKKSRKTSLRRGNSMTDCLLRKCRSAPLLVLPLLLAPWPSMAANGVYADKIVFGQSACLSGHNRDLGSHYRAGILVAIAERNALGGIDGRSLELITRDDGYEPVQAAANAQSFVAEDDVLAVIGGVGTPTSRRISPVLRAAKIPFVGHITGAGFLRDAEQYPNVVNLRASYQDEIRMLVNHTVGHHGKRRFGIIYQDDAFG